jgi:two-component system, OmpR family, response regulator ResD
MAPSVLVVDDDPAIRTLLQRICPYQGLDADTAADGMEALEKIREKEYAIALVDLMMPRLNGYEVVAQLGDAVRRPTVIVVTAMSETYLGGLDERVVHTIIRKPFDIEAVGKLVAEVARGVEAAASAADATPIP